MTPSAKAAQHIGRLFESRWARREAEPVLPVEIETIIQQAISEAVRPYEELARKWQELFPMVDDYSDGAAQYRKALHTCASEVLALSQPKGGEKG